MKTDKPTRTLPKSRSSAPPAKPEEKPAPFDAPVRAAVRFGRYASDFAGIALISLAVMTLLALMMPDLARGLLKAWTDVLTGWFGWGSVWFVSVAGVIGFWLLRRRVTNTRLVVSWWRIIALEFAAFISLGLMSVTGGHELARAEAGLDGGRIGWGLDEMIRIVLEPFGLAGDLLRGLILVLALLFSLIAAMGLAVPLVHWLNKAAGVSGPPVEDTAGHGPVVSEAPMAKPDSAAQLSGAEAAAARSKRAALPPEYRKNFKIEPEAPKTGEPLPARDERLPPVDLLQTEQSSRPDERHINLTAGLIEKTLAEFGIPAKVVGFRMGPTVTQFAVEPGFLEKEKNGSEGDIARQKIRVAQISALNRDLALALSAERLRIEAPVPGRPYVGIEVPNARSTIVRLRPIMESDAFNKIASPLAIGLGRDVSGQPVVADLARMPHLLVAGTTGSGKSVCIAAITTNLVMNNTPEDLRLVMVDPKMVELVRFNGLPHLLGKVETNLERILAVLRWTVSEMDRRYKVLEGAHVRNIDTYNRKARKHKGQPPMPRIVVMIDELADLMMSAPDQTEHNLVRLAQLARATGIHLVVATQRPSTDVVTGLIKANFPARIAFTVASSIDSRVILDVNGAESLLGRGDMLFLPPDAASPIRSQGALITDGEIERIIGFWQKAIPPDPDQQSPWEEMIENETVMSEKDGLVEKAIAIVRETQRANASMLQRRLRIGYPRAARLMDELEDLGVIGPSQGGGREREVLVGNEGGPANGPAGGSPPGSPPSEPR